VRPGLKTSFARLLDGTIVQIGFGEAAFAFALNCLLDPMSKLRVGEWAKTIYRPEWERLEPNHFSFRHAVEKVKHQVLPEAGDPRGMVSEKLPGEIEGAQLIEGCEPCRYSRKCNLKRNDLVYQGKFIPECGLDPQEPQYHTSKGFTHSGDVTKFIVIRWLKLPNPRSISMSRKVPRRYKPDRRSGLRGIFCFQKRRITLCAGNRAIGKR